MGRPLTCLLGCLLLLTPAWAQDPTSPKPAERLTKDLRSASEAELREEARQLGVPLPTDAPRRVLVELVVKARLSARAASPRNAPDRLARYRRADGTLDWKRLSSERGLREAGGLAHFGMALFLKELAVVAQTGDRLRIEEFFDGLLTTDFYKHYGAFVVGARAGELAYGRYLQRFVKPGFVNGILKTNVALAAGLALPQVLEGDFKARTFMISLGSLGLSSTAVKASLQQLAWVKRLSTVRRLTTTGRTAAALGRMSGVGGWVYTTAELAVVLLVAEKVDALVNEWADQRDARDHLQDAGQRYFDAINAPQVSAESIAEATAAYRDAWASYRAFLSRPIAADEARLAQRLQRFARAAKLAEDRRLALVARAAKHERLARRLRERHGSVEAYAAAMAKKNDAKLQTKVDQALEAYSQSRRAHAERLYEKGSRPAALIDEDPEALSGAGVDGRTDFMAKRTRQRARAAFGAKHRRASRNRLQSYEDEGQVLGVMAKRLEDRGHPKLATLVRAQAEQVATVRQADAELWKGERRDGLTAALR